MVDISVVIPCLNEEQTIAACIDKARRAFREMRREGEVVVVDNGSTDRSSAIAVEHGARVIAEPRKGYGSALRRGISEAKGRCIVMGDGDDTYDFSHIAPFIQSLDKGNDLVMGSRFRGTIKPGAMSWSHRYIGNPVLSGMLRVLFGGKVSDSHCGLRAFTWEAYARMDLQTTGMEFASEMVIHAMKKGLRIAEVPITYFPRRGESKLESLKDAWRHIRFMLLYSPVHLYFVPAVLMFVPGMYLLVKFLFGPVWLFGHPWDIRSMVFASMLALLGWQLFAFGFCAVAYGQSVGLIESDFVRRLTRVLSLERLAGGGMAVFLVGLFFTVRLFYIWALRGFGELHIYEIDTIKMGIFSVTFMSIGIQIIFAGFLSSMFTIKYRK